MSGSWVGSPSWMTGGRPADLLGDCSEPVATIPLLSCSVCPGRALLRGTPRVRVVPVHRVTLTAPRKSHPGSARTRALAPSARRWQDAGVPRTQYLTATSLDGFIADPDNSLDWLFAVEQGEGADERWDAFMAQVGAMAMGATTYQWCVDHDKLLDDPHKWQEYYGDRPCWVFTHRDLPAVPGADLRFVRGDVAPVHAEMLTAAGERNVWLVGGGGLVADFHDAGLLDEIRVHVAPLTLGAGAPLLPRRIEGLRIRSVRENGQMVDIVY